MGKSPILQYHKIEKGSLSYNQCFPFSFAVSKIWPFFEKNKLQIFCHQVMKFCPQKITGYNTLFLNT